MQSFEGHASKDRLYGPDKLQNHANEGKGKEKRREQEGRKKKKKKGNGCALSFFITVTLEIVFGRKKPVGRKRSIGGSVFKNPARRI